MDTRRTDDQPLRAEQAARLLGVNERTVRRWIASGKLSGTARPWATTRAAVEAFRAQQPRSNGTGLEHQVPQQDGLPDRVPDSGALLSRPPARMGVYAITHTPTGRTYIGSSLDIEARMRDHRATLARGHHHNRGLQEAWTGDGALSFRWSVRDYAESEEELPVLEQQWISSMRPYYNHRQTAGRARTRPALRYVRRPAASQTPVSAGAGGVLAAGVLGELSAARAQLVELARENGRLQAEVRRLDAELAQCRREVSERRTPNAEGGRRGGVLRRVGPWLSRITTR